MNVSETVYKREYYALRYRSVVNDAFQHYSAHFREELGVAVSVGDVYMELTHVYPDLTIHLTLFHAEITDGVPKLLEHCAMDWITPEEIGGYDFCPADEEILARLRLAGKTATE